MLKIDRMKVAELVMSISLSFTQFSAWTSQHRRAMSHSKVRQSYYSLIVMGKSTIKLQIERNTIELANAFDVYVQRVICNHNFPVSLWQSEMEHCCTLIYCLSPSKMIFQ